jgi:hypothetical protein
MFDFDSAIPRFESWRPSQPRRSLAGESLHFAKTRHFRRLVAKRPGSAEGSRPSRAEIPKLRGQSLRTDFSISEICLRECPETGCVSAETGSKPRPCIDRSVMTWRDLPPCYKQSLAANQSLRSAQTVHPTQSARRPRRRRKLILRLCCQKVVPIEVGSALSLETDPDSQSPDVGE